MKYVNLEKDLCVIWCYGEFDIELVEVIFFVFFIYFCIVVGDQFEQSWGFWVEESKLWLFQQVYSNIVDDSSRDFSILKN